MFRKGSTSSSLAYTPVRAKVRSAYTQSPIIPAILNPRPSTNKSKKKPGSATQKNVNNKIFFEPNRL